MAVVITHRCINCAACIDECPTEAIVDNDDNPTGEDIYYVFPEKCTECNEQKNEPACIEVCPTENCIILDDNNSNKNNSATNDIKHNNNNSDSNDSKSWVYDVSDGRLTSPDVTSYEGGYSGKKGIWQNNSNYQDIKNHGPIPVGIWEIGASDNSKGPMTIDLIPANGTETYGRDLFRVHGDNNLLNNTASSGCIIFGPNIREHIKNSNIKVLIVK